MPARAKTLFERMSSVVATAKPTPGGYMRQCRMRAGLTLGQCAERIAGRDGRHRAQRDLQQMERNQPGDYLILVTCLHDQAVFPFDFATFIALAAKTSDAVLDPDAEV